MEAVKALAAERGVSLGIHRSIAEFISKVHEEHPEWELRDAFRHAENLRVNSYEDHLPEDYAFESGEAIRRAIDLLLRKAERAAP